MEVDCCTNRGIGNSDFAAQISKHTREVVEGKKLHEDEDRTQHSYQPPLISLFLFT